MALDSTSEDAEFDDSEKNENEDSHIHNELPPEAARIGVEFLRRFDVQAGDQQPMEFFFYAKELENALRLSSYLEKFYGYTLYGVDSHLNEWSIFGCTEGLPMLTELFEEWINSMNDAARKFNCRFDGWGTLLE